jgi:amidase
MRFGLRGDQVTPFDAGIDWPDEIDGVKMEHDCTWRKSAYWISMLPVRFGPGGEDADGLPVGMQIVVRHGNDRGVPRIAVEQAL